MSDTYKEKTIDKKNEQEQFFTSDIKNRFSERLFEVMENESNSSFAQKCGISEATIRKYKKGETTPNLEILEAISQASGKDPLWFLKDQETETETETELNAQIDDYENLCDIRYINKYSVAASAGGGSYVEEESVVEKYPFAVEYLKRHRISYADLLIVEAKGDSMAPYIESGDDLLLKRVEFNADKPISGVHVISLHGYLKVKRLEYSIRNGGYRIISDNKLYNEEFISHDELEQNLMKVIGEVVIVMGKPPSPPS